MRATSSAVPPASQAALRRCWVVRLAQMRVPGFEKRKIIVLLMHSQPVPEVALDGDRAKALPAAQPAAVDAVQVLLIDGLLKRLAGTLAAQDSRQPLAGLVPVAQAQPLVGGDLDETVPQAPVLVANPAAEQPLAP